MRVIIGLAVAFSILFLGVVTVGYLYNHLSYLSIWNSPIWKAWKVPLIVCAVILVLAMLLYINYRVQQKNEKAERELARTQGWGYCLSTDDTEGLMPKILANLKTVSPGKNFSVTGSIMTVPLEKGKFFLFACSYSSGKKNSSFGSACLIESERLRGMRTPVEIFPRTLLDRALTFSKVDMGNSEFARSYIVSAQDPAEAHRIINESMQAMLVEYKKSPEFIGNFEIALGPGGALILNWSQALPDDWLALGDVGRRFAYAIR